MKRELAALLLLAAFGSCADSGDSPDAAPDTAPTREAAGGHDLEATLRAALDDLVVASMDQDYQAFRATARDPDWQAQLLSRSLQERRTLAGQLRGMSREANSNKAQDIMDVTPSEVEKVMRDRGVRQLIHGHTHRPAQHSMATGTRWVLGDWASKGWAIEASPDIINLYNFDI